MLLTLHDAADCCAISWHTLRRAIYAGELAVVKLGKTARGWRIDPEDLSRYIAAKRQPEGQCRSEKGGRDTLSMSASVIAELDALLEPTKKRRPSKLASVTPLKPLDAG